jgi:hypothetical protein
MAEDNRIILDYDEVADLDDKKLEEAKKKFQETAYTMVRDVTPVVGEAQSYKYALQDAETLAKAARSEEGYDDMTPLEALGYVGLTGLGVAGMLPFVGPYAKKAAQGIRALMPRRGTREIGGQTLPGVQANEFQRMNLDTPMNDEIRTAIQNDPRFEIFVRGLPEYRRTPEYLETNMAEYRNIFRNDPDQMARFNEQYSLRDSKVLSRTEEMAQMNKNQADFDAKVTGNSSRSLTIPKEPLTFGKGIRQTQDDTVRSYLGSAAWDEVNRSGNAVGTPQEWMGFLKGLRNKGIKAEELSDSGLLIFGKGGEPVGGDIFNLAKENPKIKITKQEILASLESNPTFRMKVKDYKYPINTDEVLNVYPNFAKLSREVESMILRNTTEMSNVQARSQLNKITDDLNNDRIDFNDLASSLSASPNKLASLEATKVRLENSLNNFKDNDKILVRALIDEYDKAIGIASRATEATSAPRHKGTFPGGGFDYREKVTYLNEAIPGNSLSMRVYGSHFNEPNAVTFVRYDTRGVDNYGDTYFMVELQSDPHQSLSKAASRQNKEFQKGITKNSSVDMVRKNPNSKAIRTRVIKREIDDLLNKQNELQKINMERPLAPPEIEELDSIMKQIKTKERELNRMPARQGEMAGGSSYERGSMYDEDNLTYDYFPMGNEATWVKANIKGLINDARKNNKRYIALAPADFFQLTINNKQKIEQFYGLGNKQLSDDLIFFGDSKKVPFDNKDGSGLGKYRNYKTDELMGMAVVPKAMKDVAKELGATFTTKKVYHTDQNKPYKLYDNEKKVPAYAFSKKYEMEEFYNNLDRKGGLEMIKMDADDPRNFVESIVIDLQGTNKKAKMKAYKFGGFVQVDRSNFAPLF